MTRNRGIKIINEFHRIIENCSKYDPRDVTLCCEDQDIDAHRNVLMAHSPYFLELLTDRPTENLVVALNKVDGDIFKYVLRYMYDGKVRVAKDKMGNLKELMVRFRMPIPDVVNHFLDEQINNMRKFHNSTSAFLPHVFSSDCFLSENKHGAQGPAKCDEFILTFQAILNNLNKSNVDEVSHEFLATNQTITAEQIDIIIRMVLQKVINVSLNYVNLGTMAALMLAIKKMNSSNEFQNKLCDFSIGLFRDAFNYMPSKPMAFIDSNKLCALDKQVNLIENANFYMASYRCNRIAHFIGHLYLVNLIEATDICSVIELSQSKMDSVDVNAVMRAMAIAFRRIHLQIRTNDDDRLALLNRTQLQMLQRIVAKTKLFWAFSDETETCCNIQMSSDIRIILTSPWYTGIQSTVEHMNWVRFSVSDE